MKELVMDTSEVKSGVVSMADLIGEMVDLVEEGFMKNRMEFLADAMQKEEEVNRTEKNLMQQILSLPKGPSNRKELSSLSQAIESLERMGDEISGLIERIEVKVAEKLLFAQEAVTQFSEVYGATKESVALMRQFLRSKNKDTAGRVIENGLRVKDLVERYRKEHADRLVQGICTPMSANMYFDMLDFTGNLARHSSNIVKLG